jgi:hypothetical protein
MLAFRISGTGAYHAYIDCRYAFPANSLNPRKMGGLVIPQCDNEWDYDVPDRVTRAVNAFDERDTLSTMLHLRWQIRALLREVKMADLTVPELVSIIAILAPVGERPVINEWDYDVVGRVTDAVDAMDTRDGYHACTPAKLCAQLRELMKAVKLTDLSVQELAAMLAVLAPANGRRLLTLTFAKILRPILRIVDGIDDVADDGDAALQLCE